MGGLTASQRGLVEAAADRWRGIIVAGIPPVSVEGRVINDIEILVHATHIDGKGGQMGRAGARTLRPASAGAAAFLPAQGELYFDIADLADMESRGTLGNTILHEMGHALGFGNTWPIKRLIYNANTSNPLFMGRQAIAEYSALTGINSGSVPVENQGGGVTRNLHWRDSIFGIELMSGFTIGSAAPISRVTIASFRDLGYVVNINAADHYRLPSRDEFVEHEHLYKHIIRERGYFLPTVPEILSEDSVIRPRS
jgi:hypothetical protein